jgi:hypothetical protein
MYWGQAPFFSSADEKNGACPLSYFLLKRCMVQNYHDSDLARDAEDRIAAMHEG